MQKALRLLLKDAVITSVVAIVVAKFIKYGKIFILKIKNLFQLLF